jgi:hypothetical protein
MDNQWYVYILYAVIHFTLLYTTIHFYAHYHTPYPPIYQQCEIKISFVMDVRPDSWLEKRGEKRTIDTHLTHTLHTITLFTTRT